MQILKNLSFEKFQKSATSFEVDPNNLKNSYLKTYPEFLKYFDTPNEITEHDLIISSHFVYGWMPTIINLRLENKNQVLSLLNQVKAGHLLTGPELGTLKKAINNSLVGTSKLLHFINPKNYAIWDSRIYRYLTAKDSTGGVAKVSLYLEYLKGLEEIANNEEYDEVHNKITKAVGYEIRSNRAIELVMFEADRKNQLELKTKTLK
jgi:hypothetical protein